MNQPIKRALALLLILSLSLPCAALGAGMYSPNEAYEFLVGSVIFQLSAESQAQMRQAFAAARGQIAALALKCLDENEPDWTYETGADGEKRMLYQGKRVAVISDIDDTLVDGVHYTADIVGANGDYNNAAFARFVLSDGCTALPGAVDFVNFCVECGVEFFYITNRYDQGYKIGQSDSVSSYEKSVRGGAGLYIGADGKEIGSTIYQTLGRSFYDITLESMARLGFPIDDRHLIVNDLKLHGESKEQARAAVRAGCDSYPTGQRGDGNRMGTALTVALEPHHVALLLGDQMGDFTDAFSAPELDAVRRAALTEQYADRWGTEWIVLPNAVYGSAFASALKYGVTKLFKAYSYVQ